MSESRPRSEEMDKILKAFDHQVFVHLSEIKIDYWCYKKFTCYCGMRWFAHLRDITEHTCPLNSNMKRWAYYDNTKAVYHDSFLSSLQSYLLRCKTVYPLSSMKFYGYSATGDQPQEYDDEIIIDIQDSMEVIANLTGEKSWLSLKGQPNTREVSCEGTAYILIPENDVARPKSHEIIKQSFVEKRINR